MNMAALAGCGAGLLALMPVGTEPTPTSTVFMKTLADGHVITVRSSQREEYVDVSKEEQAKLPEGVFLVPGNVTRYEYVAYLGRPGAEETQIWRRSHTRGALSSVELFTELRVHDVAVRANRTAVLYSARAVSVDLTERDALGECSHVATQELFLQSRSFGALEAGRLVWLDGLYVLLKDTLSQETIWLVEPNQARKVYTRKDASP